MGFVYVGHFQGHNLAGGFPHFRDLFLGFCWILLGFCGILLGLTRIGWSLARFFLMFLWDDFVRVLWECDKGACAKGCRWLALFSDFLRFLWGFVRVVWDFVRVM